ncbi:hypothetical protein [Streptomyces sp. NPDC058084]
MTSHSGGRRVPARADGATVPAAVTRCAAAFAAVVTLASAVAGVLAQLLM